MTWAALEPTRGTFVWSTLDAEVEASAQGGQSVTLVLGMTPSWASSCPGVASTYGPGATCMPANLADWDTYVSAVVARYKERIAAYEVWSNPANPANWSGAPTTVAVDMTTLATTASALVHAGDPAASVVSPALNSDMLQAFAAVGGAASVDVIATSLTPSSAPESIVATLTAIRANLAAAKLSSKPIWNEQDAWLLDSADASMDTQAAYVARTLLLNAGLGIRRMHWYAWDDTSTGALALSDASGLQTQSAAAYRVVGQWLTGAQINGCSANAQNVWTCQLVRDGQSAWVEWYAGTGSVQVSTLGATSQTDLNGNFTALNGSGSISLSAAPVLLQ